MLVAPPELAMQVAAGGSLTPGATIRVVAPAVAPGALTATVLAADHDTLVLKVEGEAAGRWETIALQRVRVSPGPSGGVAVSVSVSTLIPLQRRPSAR